MEVKIFGANARQRLKSINFIYLGAYVVTFVKPMCFGERTCESICVTNENESNHHDIMLDLGS